MGTKVKHFFKRPFFLPYVLNKIQSLNYRVDPDGPDFDPVPDVIEMYFADYPYDRYGPLS